MDFRCVVLKRPFNKVGETSQELHWRWYGMADRKDA